MNISSTLYNLGSVVYLSMGNAVGISPILQLYKKGILIGMGTDAYTNFLGQGRTR